MSVQSEYKQASAQFEQKHYRDADLNDPIYIRELACIEVARNATISAGGYLRPTFSPNRSILDRLLWRSRERYATYRVPRVKTIDWLWSKYRPTPWIGADNEKVLEAWIRILYTPSLSKIVNVSNLIDRYRAELDQFYTNVHFTTTEEWLQLAEEISDKLPPYG